MRLDKFLCEMNIGTRSQVKNFVRQGQISVNGEIVKNADLKIDEQRDVITYKGQVLHYCEFYYYMLNKPKGVVSATRDNAADTVVSLLKEDNRDDIFPVGRLDKDTTGFVLLTNDGDLAHKLLSPKKHVDKTYRVTMEHALSLEDIQALEQGVDIGEEQLTLPAKVIVESEKVIQLIIHEGKFHQVKRMLLAVNNGVVELERISFGPLKLDAQLAPGAYRALTEAEICLLKQGTN